METVDIELYAATTVFFALAIAAMCILLDYSEYNDDDFNEIL